MPIAKLIAVDRAVHELRCGRAVDIDGTACINAEFAGKKPAGKAVNAKTAKSKIEKAAVELAKIALLAPQVILFKSKDKLLKVKAADILSYNENADKSLEMVADAPLTLCDARNASIKAFRSKNGAAEHLAIIIGKPGSEPVVRIHSACYTGDLLGSLACDCGDQLRGAIKLIEASGGGVIVYLMQEGRGIGLVNKLRAYKLQSKGMDTVEANVHLGFEDEERSFESAAIILKKLGIKKVKLVTNNPKKIKGLEKFGVKVTKRLPMVIRHEHNHSYLDVKSAKSGHII